MEAGRVTLTLTLRQGTVTGVEVTSTRNPFAARVLQGKRVDVALQTVPLMFSLCGNAQAACAVSAVEAAMDVTVPAPTHALREALVGLESLGIHAWQVALDWPALLGFPAQPALLKDVNNAQRSLVTACCGGRVAWTVGGPAAAERLPDGATVTSHLERFVTVFGLPPPEDVRALEAWTHNPQPGPHAVRAVLQRGEAALGTSGHPMLPALTAGVLDQALSSEDSFEAAPIWNGAPAETGPLARQYKHPLVAALAQEHGVGLLVRLVSRLLDAHATLQRVTGLLRGLERVAPTVAAPRHAHGHGVATVETARGTLAHAVTLEEDTISRWRVVAPTEWNFHPRGPIQHILRGLCADDGNALKDRARLLVLALDPCVEFVVEVARA